MQRSASFAVTALASLLGFCLVCHPVSSAPFEDRLGFCKPYTWLFGDSVAPPRVLMVGDVNGDGFADFLSTSPSGKFIDISLNGRGLKPLRNTRLVSDLPQTVVSQCVGHFGGKPARQGGVDIALLGDKGRLSIAHNDGTGKFGEMTRLTHLTDTDGPVWLFPVSLQGIDGVLVTLANPEGNLDDWKLDHLAVVNASGRVRLIDTGSGRILRDQILPGPILDVAAGRIFGDHATLACSILACRVGDSVHIYRLNRELTKIASIRTPKGPEALAIGDANGDGRADVFVNGTLFLGPDFRRQIPISNWREGKLPTRVFMVDMVGCGRADLVVQHLGKDYFGSAETDCDIYLTYNENDSDWDRDGISNEEEAKLQTDPLHRDTDADGLLDGWEVGGFAGIDFPGMGASPRHKDVFVLNLPTGNTPIDRIETAMKESVVPFFANLPYTNLDGSKGFALHYTMMPAASEEQTKGKGWGELSMETFPKDKIGLFHWMQVSGMGGGGQSGQLADSGSTGMGSWVHEFGHQLGLSHTGKWGTWSPTYTSIMNYVYSYSFDGDGKKVHFSSGEFCNAVLNESRLIEKLPFSIRDLHFLSQRPYRFRMKTAGPNETFIDWNWNGVFDEKPVKACITYGYGVSGGKRLQPSGTQSFSLNGPFELYTDYQAALAEHKGKLYMFTASRGPLKPNAPRPESAELVMQTYQGKRAWSKPVSVAPKVTNDPAAVSDGKTLYVLYLTPDGVAYRFGQPEALSEAKLIPDTKGLYVSAVNWKGTIYTFFYKDAETAIIYRSINGANLGPVIDLGIKGTIPPGLGVDTKRNQLLLGTAAIQELPVDETRNRPRPTPPATSTQDRPRPNIPQRPTTHWQLYRLAWDAKSGVFKQVGTPEWLGGENARWTGDRRPTIIFDSRTEAGPEGRIYWIARRSARGNNTAAGFLVLQTIGYKDINNGWMNWRYYDEWTNTRSGISAAWFDDDIILATTWASGTASGDCGVYCAYQGTAISNTDMSDYDDIALMANYGMARSIQTFAVMPPAK